MRGAVLLAVPNAERVLAQATGSAGSSFRLHTCQGKIMETSQENPVGEKSGTKRPMLGKLGLQKYLYAVVVTLCLAILLGGLTGCAEKEVERRAREAKEEQERKQKLVQEQTAARQAANEKSYAGTPEQREKRRQEFWRQQAELEKEWLAKKLVAIAVVEGKQQAPGSVLPPEIVTKSSEVLNGACPAYDNLKIGTRFRVTAELSGKYGLPESFYELDRTCRPVVIVEAAQRQRQKEQEANRCAAPFYGFYAGEGITIEKNEQQFFGYPPGRYYLSDHCRPVLLGGDKQVAASVRTEAYKEANERLRPLQKAYFDTAAARQSKAKEEGRLEAMPAKNCPAPYQGFSPGQPVFVKNAGNSSKLIPVGQWWFDIDCKPQWFGPLEVEEPGDIVIQKERNKWAEIEAWFMVGGGCALIVLFLIHRVTLRLTGRGLIEWLRTGRKQG